MCFLLFALTQALFHGPILALQYAKRIAVSKGPALGAALLHLLHLYASTTTMVEEARNHDHSNCARSAPYLAGAYRDGNNPATGRTPRPCLDSRTHRATRRTTATTRLRV